MWRRRKAEGPDRTHLSFVLTQAPVAVNPAATLDAYKRRFPAAPPVAPAGEEGGIVRIAARDGKTRSFIAPMPAAVPDQEADNAAAQSLCALRPGGFVLAPHRGHFVVSTRASGLPIVESLKRHTLVVAATTEAHEAVGIYEGNARATHATAFYLDVAATEDVPLMLWTGISLVSEQPERLSIWASRSTCSPTSSTVAPRSELAKLLDAPSPRSGRCGTFRLRSIPGRQWRA